MNGSSPFTTAKPAWSRSRRLTVAGLLGLALSPVLAAAEGSGDWLPRYGLMPEGDARSTPGTDQQTRTQDQWNWYNQQFLHGRQANGAATGASAPPSLSARERPWGSLPTEAERERSAPSQDRWPNSGAGAARPGGDGWRENGPRGESAWGQGQAPLSRGAPSAQEEWPANQSAGEYGQRPGGSSWSAPAAGGSYPGWKRAEPYTPPPSTDPRAPLSAEQDRGRGGPPYGGDGYAGRPGDYERGGYGQDDGRPGGYGAPSYGGHPPGGYGGAPTGRPGDEWSRPYDRRDEGSGYSSPPPRQEPPVGRTEPWDDRRSTWPDDRRGERWQNGGGEGRSTPWNALDRPMRDWWSTPWTNGHRYYGW